MIKILLINKPKDITSYDVIRKIKKISGIKKIGHTGTLDPFATGLLILLIGKESTKYQKYFMELPKVYKANIHLGQETDTYDSTGKILNIYYGKLPSLIEIKEVLREFEGEIFQVPPPYSAKKLKGKRAYELARKGIFLKLEPRKVKIYYIKILKYKEPELFLEMKVSSGTYIRSFAFDLGRKLGCLGFLKELQRIKIGEFSLENAVDFDKINKENWEKFIKKLPGWPSG